MRYLNDDEVRRLVNAAGPEFRPIVQASLLTGARWGELRNVQVGDVDLQSATVRLVETKGGVPRDCYLEAEGLMLFTEKTAGKTSADLVFPAPNGKRWADAMQIRRMVDACEAGKVSPVASFHDLRRTYGARLARAGVPMSVIAQALGHADERVTRKHYAHLSPSYVSQTVPRTCCGAWNRPAIERGKDDRIILILLVAALVVAGRGKGSSLVHRHSADAAPSKSRGDACGVSDEN